MRYNPVTRRSALRAAAGAMLAAPFVRGAYAAGELSCGFIDHWVPGANDALSRLCREWGERENVDLSIDFITTLGDKITLTAASEAQARSGHDILTLLTWYAPAHAPDLERVDDVMAALIAQHGPTSPAIEYLARQDGHWIAVPSVANSLNEPCVARIDLLRHMSASTSFQCTRRAESRSGAHSDMGLGAFSDGRRKMLQSRLPVRHVARHWAGFGELDWRSLCRLRRATSRQGWSYHGPKRRSKRGARMVQADRAVPSGQRFFLG